MNLTIEKAELNGALAIVSKALSAKASNPILEGIYFSARDDRIKMCCTDLSMQIEHSVVADIDEGGEIVMPGKLFMDMVRKLPSAEIHIKTEGNTIEIKSGKSHFKLQGMSTDGFTMMGGGNIERTVKIGSDIIKRMAKETLFAVAQDESKPILTGLLMETSADCLSFVALDGYRLAIAKHQYTFDGESQVVVPARGMSEISRTICDMADIINIGFSKTHVCVESGGTRFLSRLLDGEFIKYKQILPTSANTAVRVCRSELLDALNRVAVISATSKTNIISFEIADDQIHIAAKSEIGNASEDIECNLRGEGLTIAFNTRYMSEALSAGRDEYVMLEMTSAQSPCVVKPVNGNEFYYLVLPVRTFN